MVPPRMPHRAPNSDPNKTGIKRGTYKDNNGATSPECQENKGLFSVGEKNGKKLMKINWRKERETVFAVAQSKRRDWISETPTETPTKKKLNPLLNFDKEGL